MTQDLIVLIPVLIRDVKTHQRANNVGVKNSILGKIFAKFCAVLSRKLLMSGFRDFGGIFWHFFSLSLFGSFGPFRLLCHVAIYVCRIIYAFCGVIFFFLAQSLFV